MTAEQRPTWLTNGRAFLDGYIGSTPAVLRVAWDNYNRNIDAVMTENSALEARIQELETALREIEHKATHSDWTARDWTRQQWAADIARAALEAKEQAQQ